MTAQRRIHLLSFQAFRRLFFPHFFRSKKGCISNFQASSASFQHSHGIELSVNLARSLTLPHLTSPMFRNDAHPLLQDFFLHWLLLLQTRNSRWEGRFQNKEGGMSWEPYSHDSPIITTSPYYWHYCNCAHDTSSSRVTRNRRQRGRRSRPTLHAGAAIAAIASRVFTSPF